MSDDAVSWTEKYRPKTLSEVEGNPSAVRELKAWADAWEEGRPDEPAVTLVGDPGIGKTSAALALANERGWSVIELNASDARNKDAIEKVATRGAVSQGFSATGDYQRAGEKQRKLIILDEADNVFGREDRGGMKQIAKTLKETQQPIVLIANDGYELSRRSSTVKRLSKEIKFKNVQDRTIGKILRRICQEEGIDAQIEAINALASHADGDVRAAVSDLESIARGTGRLTLDDVDDLGYRDQTATIFDALEDILQANDFQSAKEASYDLDEDPETLLLWIEENIPREYDDPTDRARAMDVVARADEFLGATQRTRYYRFWSYVSDLITGGVATAKQGNYSGWTRYQFPSWLRKMGRSKKQRKLRDDLGSKVGTAYHMGTKGAREHLFPLLGFISQRSETFATHVAADLDLTDDELALLLDTKKSAKAVKRILEAAEELEEERGQPREHHVSIHVPGGTTTGEGETSPEEDEAESDDDEDEEPEDEESQANLFEF